MCFWVYFENVDWADIFSFGGEAIPEEEAWEVYWLMFYL